MSNKVHEIFTLNDIGNLITQENVDFLIADLTESLLLIADIKEKIKEDTGEYPTDFFKSLSICFDGKVGVDKISLNGDIYELKNNENA